MLLVATALLAPVIAPYDPLKIKSSERLQRPSASHLLGTDDFGRDILSRVIYGARISMLLGLGAVAISTLLAAVIGIVSGYYGGRVDTVLQRCIDTMMAFPGLVVLLTIMAMLGQGLGNVILALGIGGTAGNARIIRSAVLAVRENQYVEVARATGCRDWQIILRHILPNIAAPIMVVATLGLGVAILAESSAELPRLRRAAAHAVVGGDAQRIGPDLHAPGAVDGRVPGHCHQPGRLRLQHAGRRPPRLPGSEAPRRPAGSVRHHEIGAIFPQTEIGNDPVAIRDYAQAVEDLGYHHIACLRSRARCQPRPPGWTGPYTSDTPFHEPFVLFGYLAGLTRRIELVTGVIILPQRQTALVAKQAAQVDVLHRAGAAAWRRHWLELSRVRSVESGLPARGARIEEQVEVLRACGRSRGHIPRALASD